MAFRLRSLVAAAIFMSMVLSLLFFAAPAPDALKERVRRWSALSRSPEEAAERAAGAVDADAIDADGSERAGEAPEPPEDSPFYGDFPMFGGMMDLWLSENLSNSLLDLERRRGRRELSEFFVEDNDVKLSEEEVD